MNIERGFSIIYPNGDEKYYTWSYQKINDEEHEIHIQDTRGFNEKLVIYSLGEDVYVKGKLGLINRHTTLLSSKLYNIAEKILLKDALKEKDERLKYLSPMLHNLGNELKRNYPNEYMFVKDLLGFKISDSPQTHLIFLVY